MVKGIRYFGGKRYIRYYGGSRKIVSEGKRKLQARGKSVRVIKEKVGYGLYADGKFVDL